MTRIKNYALLTQSLDMIPLRIMPGVAGHGNFKWRLYWSLSGSLEMTWLVRHHSNIAPATTIAPIIA